LSFAVIPRRYVVAHYVLKKGDRWRRIERAQPVTGSMEGHRAGERTMAGKTVLITGATTQVGHALGLARMEQT
jgi:NADPH:quinone reductase-like Zn-dependent oxidoreductase